MTPNDLGFWRWILLGKKGNELCILLIIDVQVGIYGMVESLHLGFIEGTLVSGFIGFGTFTDIDFKNRGKELMHDFS